MEPTKDINLDPKTPARVNLESLQIAEPPISGSPIPLTLPYFTSPSGHILYLDLYLPPDTTSDTSESSSSASPPAAAVPHPNPTAKEIPFVIFFHGGGLLYGSRKHILPAFLQDTLAKEFAFISVSHRFILPCTAHDILEDIVHLVEYILSLPTTTFASTTTQDQSSTTGSGAALTNSTINEDILTIMTNSPYRLSQKTYFVSGYSAGTYPARMLCLMNEIITSHAHAHHWKLKNFQPAPPTAAFFVSGRGGDWFCPQYVFPKGMTRRSDHAYDRWLYLSKGRTPQQQLKQRSRMSEVSDLDNLRYHPKKSRPPAPLIVMKETRASNSRMGVAMAFYQFGIELDYLTGICGLSEKILNTYFIPTTAPETLPALQDLIPPEARVLFPEIYLQNKEIAKEHCPVFFLHGTGDKTVRISEAQRTAEQLKQAGVLVKLVPVLEWGHNWMDVEWDRCGGGEGGVLQFFRSAAVMKEEKEKGVEVERAVGEGAME